MSLVDVLEAARHKLFLYRKSCGSSYVGGVEYSSLIKMLDTEIEKLRGKPPGESA